MKIIRPAFNVCEEILDYLHHYSEEEPLGEKKIIGAIGKTASYTKKSLNFLVSIGIVELINNSYSANSKALMQLDSGVLSPVIIKKRMTEHSLFKEYYTLRHKGKSEKQAANYIITINELDLNNDSLIKSFQIWTKYLKKENKSPQTNGVSQVKDVNSFMWIDDNGHLNFDKQSHSEFILNQLNYKTGVIGDGSIFVDPERIEALKEINHKDFDLSKLIRKCEELNIAYSTECYFSVGMLIRALIDHVPPIFNRKNFSDVTRWYGTRSFMDSMVHLDKSSRKISDSMLHTHIRKKEVLPSKTQVNFSSDIDVLLAEIIRVLD